MTNERRRPGLLDLGLEPLDREHRGQLEHMERLERAIERGSPAQEVNRLTEDLIQYLQAHFTAEQIAMRESAYPAYEIHLREHEEAIALVRELQERSRSGDPSAAGALEALRHKLVAHVHTSDASLARFLRGRRTELSSEH